MDMPDRVPLDPDHGFTSTERPLPQAAPPPPPARPCLRFRGSDTPAHKHARLQCMLHPEERVGRYRLELDAAGGGLSVCVGRGGGGPRGGVSMQVSV